MSKPKIEVCLSPELVHLMDLKGKIAVVVDVLRATSCMVTAMSEGVTKIIPVCDLNECKALQKEGFIGAAERNGIKEEGFQFGNSPYSYINNDVKGESLAITTTNGTVAIEKSKGADEVIVGAFINLKSVVNYLLKQQKDAIVVCAGWKGRVNLEDTLFAGAVVEGVKAIFDTTSDEAIVAQSSYNVAKSDLKASLSNCAHVQRLSKQTDIGKDIDFCLTEDIYDVLPVLEGDGLVIK